ncbi:TPT-domain-containing protein, partial [Clavulina sp. PMI_390]
RRRLWWRNAIIDCMFMATWFIFATSLSLYNKWMFSPTKYGFPNPLFVTMMHMFVQWGLSGLLRTLKPETFRSARTPERADYIKRAMPTGITTGMDIGLSNLSLKTVTLSFYTMCKSSTLIFVLFFAFIFKLEVFSYRLIGVMFLIFVGTLLMVATETAFNMLGMFLVIAASAAGGLRWALTQILLVGKSGKRMGMDNPASSIFWLAPTMGVTLAILSLLIEGWGDLFWGKGSKFWVSVGTTFQTLVFLISPGVLAFVMVMSEFYIIQRVGMVPMSVAGIFKEVTTISLSAWVFGDEITPVNMVGVGITFIGIGLFTHHKYLKSVHSSTPLDAHGNPI